MKLLVSARDAGAANSIVPILAAAKQVNALVVDVVAQSPAYAILARHGFAARPINLAPASSPESGEASALRSAAADLIKDVQPDAILTGLSGPDLGIDEALIAEARNANTYSVQDYQGWVVEGFGRPARTYIVTDKDSADMVRARGVSRVIVAGYLSYSSFDEIDVAMLRAESRTAFPQDTAIVGVFAQPLELPSYRRSLKLLAQAIASLDRRAILVHRPHPRQSPKAIAADARALAEGLGAEPMKRPELSTLGLLAACDVAASCFSTVGMDLAMLNRFSVGPLGVPLFLMFEPELRAMHRVDTGSETPWAARSGIALASEAESALGEALAEALDPAVAARLWKHSRAVIGPPRLAAVAVINDIIRETSCAC